MRGNGRSRRGGCSCPLLRIEEGTAGGDGWVGGVGEGERARCWAPPHQSGHAARRWKTSSIGGALLSA